MYVQVYDIFSNVERVMDMLSKELRIMDCNTVELMVDELQKENVLQREQLNYKDEQINAITEENNAQKAESCKNAEKMEVLVKENEELRCRLNE